MAKRQRGSKGRRRQAPVVHAAAETGGRERLLFALTVVCSAFLIFLVQPMVAKRLLPWYGGAPGVWTLCLAFYQTTLFAGYAYAHVLTRLGRPWLEMSVHTALFSAALIALPVLPGDAWRPEAGSNATIEIVLALVANVALPFLFLSATGPLLQAWFARALPARSPYFLYALSNLGSMLALFAYPFAFEPNLGLAETGAHWSFSFVAVGVAVLACGVVSLWRGAASAASRTEAERAEFGLGDIALWMSLSGVAVVLLMGITNQLCLDIASVPFLWILPLSAYLLTFILCFGSERFYRRWPFVILATAALLVLPFSEPAFSRGDGWVGLQSRPAAIGLYVLLLFASCMVLHGELYRRRPAARALTAYYLWVSAGGALGGLFVGILAERMFVDYYEVPIGFAAWFALVLGLAIRDSHGPLRVGAPLWRKGAAIGVGAFVLFSMLSNERFRIVDVVHQDRSFFGVLRVMASANGSAPAHVLRHGTTLHGLQFTGPNLARLPTSYYGFAGGVGLTLTGLATGEPIRVGVVGLGAGTLAAYGRPGDLYRFYEIDPAVIGLARDSEYFTFLRDSTSEVEVVEGDGRLSLEAEERREEPGWDLLVLDAFSSDAIPVHLLTREAFALYASRLATDGVIAIHVSNRHLALGPLAFRLARSTGLSAAELRTDFAPKLSSVRSRWVLIARTPQRLEAMLRTALSSSQALGLARDHLEVAQPDPSTLARIPVWTDDYSDLLGILRGPRNATVKTQEKRSARRR